MEQVEICGLVIDKLEIKGVQVLGLSTLGKVCEAGKLVSYLFSQHTRNYDDEYAFGEEEEVRTNWQQRFLEKFDYYKLVANQLVDSAGKKLSGIVLTESGCLTMLKLLEKRIDKYKVWAVEGELKKKYFTKPTEVHKATGDAETERLVNNWMHLKNILWEPKHYGITQANGYPLVCTKCKDDYIDKTTPADLCWCCRTKYLREGK